MQYFKNTYKKKKKETQKETQNKKIFIIRSNRNKDKREKPEKTIISFKLTWAKIKYKLAWLKNS